MAVMKEKHAYQKQLSRERFSRAMAAARMEEEGKTDADIMNHFGVTETTVRQWRRLLEHKAWLKTATAEAEQKIKSN